MVLRNILTRHLWSWKSASRKSRRALRNGKQRAVLGFGGAEVLEVRTLLSGTPLIVSNLDDSGEGSLRDAINDANLNPGADTIRFDVDGTITVGSQLVITDDLTIEGPGADQIIVSGGGTTRVFAVLPGNPSDLQTAPTVSIEAISIQHGLATDAPGFDPANPANPGFAFGGGLYNLGGTVNLNRVHMSGNQAINVVSAGGAVANEFGGTLTVSRSRFEDNTSGGFLIAVGGAITSDLGPTADGGTTGQPEVHIDRSSFVGNTAQAQLGYIEGVAFSGMGGGGAILNVTGSMTVTRSHFEANQAIGGSGTPGSTSGGPGFGGAILTGDASPFGLADSTLTVSQSTFVGNSSKGGDAVSPGLAGGLADGGAIGVGNGSEAHLSQNQFHGNSATGGNGLDANGGLGTGGAVAGTGLATLEFSRNTFTQNVAEGGSGTGLGLAAAGRGGAIGLYGFELAGFLPGPANASVNRDEFEGNLAYGGAGGAIYNEGDLSVSRAKIKDNQAIGESDVFIDTFPDYVFQGVALGGGISNIGSLNVTRTVFDGNLAIGADDVVGANVILEGGVSTYPGLAVGGGLHNITSAMVSHSQFRGNVAQAGNGNFGSFAGVANGGGIYNDGSLVVNSSLITKNRAIGGNGNLGDLNPGGAYGGGITSGSVAALTGARSASLELDQSLVTGNVVQGGDGNSNLIPVPLAHAASAGIGGGVSVYQGTAEIRRTLLTGNLAEGGKGGLGAGGGVFFFSFVGPVNVVLTNSLVSQNFAIGGNQGDGLGGGVATGSLGSFFGGEATVSVGRTLVYHNSAIGGDGGNGLGGGIYNGDDSNLELERSLVFGNRAKGGAGGAGIGGGIYNLGTLDLIRARVFANFASDSDDNCFGC